MVKDGKYTVTSGVRIITANQRLSMNEDDVISRTTAESNSALFSVKMADLWL